MDTESASGGGDMVVMATLATANETVLLLEGESIDTDMAGPRLFIQQGDCIDLSYGMRSDNEPEDDDTVVEQYGPRVFVDPASMNYTGGSIFDFEDGLWGMGFHVNNLSTESSYGCDESLRTQGSIS